MSWQLQRIDFSESKLPKFKEQKQKGFVTYGEKNDFPQSLIELYKRSPKHGAIVKQKARFVGGEETTIEGNASAGRLQETVNPFEGLQDLKNKLALDYELFNGFCFEVHYNRLGEQSAYYHVDFSKVRTLDHTKYFFLDDWTKYKADDVREYPAYNPQSAKPFMVQLYYYREYDAGLGTYPLPPYIHALQYIEIDVEIANFHNNNIRNGFSNGTLVQLFKGEPTPEQARAFERKFKGKTTGTDNAGGVLIQFNEGNERPAEVSHIQPSDMDEQFLTLNNTVQQEIFIAHGVTSPMLFGMRVEGQLGGRNELIEAYEIFHKSYVNHRQDKLDRCLSYVFEAAYPGIELGTQDAELIGLDYVGLYQLGGITNDELRSELGLPESVKPDVGSSQRTIESINSLSPLVANNVLRQMTINEVRGLAGLPPVPNGDQLNTPPPTAEAFRDEATDVRLWSDNDISVFEKFGADASEFEAVPLYFADLTADELKVLGVVNGDETASVKDISSAVKVDEDEVLKILKKLQEAGKIKWTNNVVNITEIGKKAISDAGGVDKVELRYRYNVSPNAPELRGQSRPFCQRLEGLNRLYTKQDIEQMSSILGYDVWKRRGGWYTVPDSDPPLHIPHCRHEWKQVIVRRRG
jgi:DNA-binding Lrp family transcriptional regulator